MARDILLLYVPNIPTTFQVYAISFRVYMWGCIWINVSGKNYSKILLHIVKIGHTVLILHWQVDPTMLYIFAKTQPTTISTSHVVALHVPETNNPSKLHVNAIYLMSIYGGCMFIYVPHMKSLASIVRPGVQHTLPILHFILLAYTQQIWLLHGLYRSHWFILYWYIASLQEVQSVVS